MAKKATNAESSRRTNAVYGLLSQGYSRQQIIQYASEKWDIRVAQTDAYIAKARKLLEEDCAMERSAWIAEALQRLRKYEQQAAGNKQPAVAINSIQLQSKLIGLDS